MPEPARKVYDDDNSEQPITRPDLRSLEGGGQTSPASQGHLRPIPSEDSRGFPNSPPGADGAAPKGSNAVSGPHLEALEGGGQGGGAHGNLYGSASNPTSAEAPSQEGGSGVDAPNLQALEGGGDGDEASRGHLSAVSGDQVGRGYDPHDKPGLGQRFKGGLKTKKGKGALIGGGVAGLLGGGGLLFFAMLPLKIEHIVTNLQNHYASTSENAVDQTSERLLDRYITNKVLPGLGGRCHSTISAECSFAKSEGKGPISTLYNAWHEDRLEKKLADNFGLSFGKKGNTYYVNTTAGSYNLAGGEHPTSIFDAESTFKGSRSEIRNEIKMALREETLYRRVYFRFRYGKFLEKKFGIKRCIITCKLGDKYADKVAAKKVAATAYLIRRVIQPTSESYSLILQCLLAGGDYCSTNLGPANPSDGDKLSPFEKKLNEQLDAAVATAGSDKLADLVEKANRISEDGFSKFIVRETAIKMGEMFGKDLSKEATDKIVGVVPILGWITLTLKLVDVGNNIGPALRYMSYAANSAAAVQMYESYRTTASEMKSGNVDATELGSFSDALSTNLSGSKSDLSDATQTPLYGSLFGDSGPPKTTALLDNISPLSKAYADSPKPQYKCNDGSTVAAGSLVCPEEKLDRGNKTATDISNFMGQIPVIPQVAHLVSTISGAVTGVVGGAFMKVCGATYGCSGVINKLGQEASKIMPFITDKLLVSPFSGSMSGGRQFDMMAAGADVSNNAACRTQLGCAKLSDQQVADIQNQQLSEQESEFNHQSMFARLFSTNSSYSLISRLAMTMPSNLQTVSRSVLSNLLADPLGRFGSMLGSVFSGNRAFAAASPQPDPFGVIQYGYAAGSVPSNPESYWDHNCVNGPVATYDDSSGTLDVSAWLNAQKQDSGTGEAVATTTNPCLLIKASVESAGGMFNTSLLPPGSQNSDTGGSSSSASSSNSSSTLPSGNAQDLAKQILANNKIHAIGRDVTTDLQDAAAGKPSSAGKALSQTLLALIAYMGQNHTFNITALESGGSGHTSGSYHYTGDAVDVTGLDGDPIANSGIGRTTHDIALIKEVAPLMPKGSGFGQINCGTTPPLPSGITAFNDTCNHLHIQVARGAP